MKKFKGFQPSYSLKHSFKHPFASGTEERRPGIEAVHRTLGKLGYKKIGDLKASVGANEVPTRSTTTEHGEIIGSRHNHQDGHRATVNDNYRVTMHAPLEHHNKVRAAMNLSALDHEKAKTMHHNMLKWRGK